MSNSVTLGGDRLGAGKKQKVHLHGFERSSHDLSYLWRSTMAAGTLVPFLSEVALPGDTFDIDLNVDVKTHPTIGPLFGSYKVQLDVFFAPMRLYHSGLHNNMLGIGMNMAQIKLPKYKLAALPVTDGALTDFDNFQVNPSSIFSYLGVRGVGIVPESEALTEVIYRKFNAIPWLAYWEIYKQYYSNKQEEEGVVIHTAVEPGVQWINGNQINPTLANGTQIAVDQAPGFYIWPMNRASITIPINPADDYNGNNVGIWTTDNVFYSFNQLFGNNYQRVGNEIIGIIGQEFWGMSALTWDYIKVGQNVPLPISLERFPLSNIDDMRMKILANPYQSEFVVNDIVGPFAPYSLAIQVGGEIPNYDVSCRYTQEGLGIKTYQSDLFNNWLSTEWIDGPGGISEITAVSTTGDEFTIDALNLAKKVYDMLNRIAVSGGSYDDWLNAVYDHESWHRAESPVYMGGLIRELVFQEVVSNSQNENQPLGTLAGKGVMASKHKGGKVIVRCDEPGYILGIISLTPRLDYSQGTKWDNHLITLDDLHKPNLDEIGFQELITEQMAWWSTNKVPAAPTWNQRSAGKQPAWINYMTNVNQVRGNFAISANEMFMTLTRRYEPESVLGVDSYQINDLTTYIDPSKFNHIFAQTSLDSQNFWVQIAVDMYARRKMSAKVMPNL